MNTANALDIPDVDALPNSAIVIKETIVCGQPVTLFSLNTKDWFSRHEDLLAHQRWLKEQLEQFKRQCLLLKTRYGMSIREWFTPEEIFKLRRDLMLTIEQLAKNIGVSQSTVSFWQSKRRTLLREAHVKSLRGLQTKAGESASRRSHTSNYDGKTVLSPTYFSWTMMKARCQNPKHRHFKYFGGRGIRICKRWMSFENFLEDMGERPAGTTLDRFPNNYGNYEPGNCRWATRKEQANNKRNALKFTPNTLPIWRWQKEAQLLS